MNLLGEKYYKNICEQILSISKADQTEVIIYYSDHALTRYANSYIHQNVLSKNINIQIRVVIDKKIGVYSTSNIQSSYSEMVKRAISIARLSKKDPDFISLPKPKKITKKISYSKKTEKFGFLERAKFIKNVVDQVSKTKLVASGAFDINISELTVANNFGLFCYQPSSYASFSVTVSGKTSTGYAFFINKDVSMINPLDIANRAIEKAKLGENPIDISSGDYDVILEAPAVSEMMDYYSYLACNGLTYGEKSSYLRDKLGKKVFSSKLTLFDNPLDERGICQEFDYEGFPKRKLLLIDRGVPVSVCYDSYLANKYKVKNTGHALPFPNTEGPMAGNLVFLEGKYPTSKLIKKIKKGILVTRFWYVRMLHPYILNITGMTRDGTFLIENGKISRGIKNLRFTQSIPEALKNIRDVSSELIACQSMLGVGLYPSLLISNFHFSSKTEF